ncbi:MAG: TRAP transporter substrate-binding protein DctP [Oscillospiraceae bacterium]|nr:TRAP transporter substrate-binding protein DctP [Oscillospiraceae bacterium]
MYKRKRMACGLLCLSLLFACGCGQMTPAETKIVLRYAESHEEDHPAAQAAQEFARLVEEESGGRIQIRVYLDGALGTEAEALAQVQLGGVDFTSVNVDALKSAAPEIEVLQLPYLFENAEKMWDLLDSDTGQEYLDMLTQDVIGLAYFDGGQRHLYARSPLSSPADVKGRRLFTGSEGFFTQLLTLLEAQPMYGTEEDIKYSLAARSADGGESDLYTYYAKGIYKSAPYLLLTGHSRSLAVMIVSSYTMQQLPPEDQALITACARRAAYYEREVWAGQEEAIRRELKEKGVVFTKMTADVLEDFRLLLQPLYENMSQEEQKAVTRIRQALETDG